MNGTDIIISVESGTPGTYNVVGSQRDVTWTENTEVIDESSKTSRKAVFTAGRYNATMELDALYVPSDAAYVILLAAMRDGDAVRVERSESGTDIENIGAIVTSIQRNGPDQGEATCSISLQLTGDWTAA